MDTLEGCSLNGRDMHMWFDALRHPELISPWTPPLSALAFDGQAAPGKFSWLGPRSCRCVQAWLAIMGPHAPELQHSLIVSCLLVNSTDEVMRAIESDSGTNAAHMHDDGTPGTWNYSHWDELW